MRHGVLSTTVCGDMSKLRIRREKRTPGLIVPEFGRQPVLQVLESRRVLSRVLSSRETRFSMYMYDTEYAYHMKGMATKDGEGSVRSICQSLSAGQSCQL
jgi:hypothetical protein